MSDLGRYGGSATRPGVLAHRGPHEVRRNLGAESTCFHGETAAMNETVSRYMDIGLQLGAEIGTKIIGAVALWIVGRLVIRTLLRLLDRTAKVRRIDETLARYLHSVASVLLNMLLIITVLGVFGVQTFTFAGILAAAGIAIGMA